MVINILHALVQNALHPRSDLATGLNDHRRIPPSHKGEARSHALEAALPIFIMVCSALPLKKEVGRYTKEMIL